jgi:DNA/RNA-binding domain of Phe-tRNA-synthetase-like protein
LLLRSSTRSPDIGRASSSPRVLHGAAADSPPAFEPAPLDHPHLEAWRAAFRAFGAKRYSCSAEALTARGAELPRIGPLVDRYNAVSMKWAIPVGGEDLDRVVPPVRLVFASGEEPFNGPDDHPRRGEVVWVDGVGVTCRRWNWRQCVRTRLSEETSRAYFVFDALPPFSDTSLAGAMEELSALLRGGWPAVSLSSYVVAAPASTAAG